MRVLVTGAGGFLGRFVVDALLARDHRVRAMVRPTAKVDDLCGPVEVVRADLAVGSDGLDGLFEDIDALVHLAAAKGGDEQEQFAATVVGTERLLEAMARTSCRRVVLASSLAVYDWTGADGIITEETPLAPDLEARGGYTRAKVWQERVARRLAGEHGFGLTVLRPGILWGPGDPCPEGLTLAAGRVRVAFGIGSSLPLTYVENCADCCAAVTATPGTVGRTFNVVDPDAIPTRRFVRHQLACAGTGGTVVSVPYRLGVAIVGSVHLVNRALWDGRGRLPSVFGPAKFVARFRPLRFGPSPLGEVAGWLPPYDLEAALERTCRSAGHD